MRVVIAPDKFKGSLEAPKVAEALAAGFAQANPDAEITCLPVADGGEGTVAAALGSGFTPVTVDVTGPLGNRTSATFAVAGPRAVIEMAAASGLGALPPGDEGVPQQDALRASSTGTGELIVAALDAGCTEIILGVGGSASTDGGSGMIAALGARMLDAQGLQLAPAGGGMLSRLARIELDDLDPRLADARFVLAADVTNPLLGADGAAAVFAPQKGAGPAEVQQLEAGLTRFRDCLAAAIGATALELAEAPGAGAAGGVGYAALAVLGATRRPGVEVVLDFVGLAERLDGVSLVITGEGSLDTQSLGGKTPVGVAGLARQRGIATVVAVCGRSQLSEQQARGVGFEAVYALAEREPDPERSMREAYTLLRELGSELGRRYVVPDPTPTRRPPASSHQEDLMPDPTISARRLAEVNEPETIRRQIAALLADRPGAEAQPTPQSGSGHDFDLVVRARRMLSTAGITDREVGVRDGRIVAIEPYGHNLNGREIITLAEDEVLLPGLVDAHVHVNEPGRTDWEGFATATSAAAAGGVTTIIDMPLNSIPSTVNSAALQLKRLVAEPQLFVDTGFWGGAVPGNKEYLRELHDDGVFGFKCFLLHSGVEEFPHLEPDELEEYLEVLRSFDALMIVHAEDSRAIDRAPSPEGDVYARFLASRPRGAENLAIAEVIERTRWTGARTHILHLSSSDALPMLRTAKADGLDLTVETCPHYLSLMAEEIPNGATAYKCCPPIREVGNREELWAGLLDGTIDYIASDHSPATLALKDLENGDFAVAWGGIASVQLALSVVWTEARRRGIDLAQVVQWMATRPADRARLRSKGRLALGYDADLVVFAPDQAFVVDAAKLRHRNPLTPYHGKALSGVVRRTYLRGREVDFETPRGRLIRRGTD